MLLGVAFGAWRLVLAPRVVLEDHVLHVTNPLRRFDIDLALLSETTFLNTGLGLDLVDGQRRVIWARQQGLLASRAAERQDARTEGRAGRRDGCTGGGRVRDEPQRQRAKAASATVREAVASREVAAASEREDPALPTLSQGRS